MALSDRLTLETAKPKSKFELWLETLTPENYAIVLGWMMNPELSHASIVRMIHDDDPEDGFTGYATTKNTVSDWRRAHGVG